MTLMGFTGNKADSIPRYTRARNTRPSSRLSQEYIRWQDPQITPFINPKTSLNYIQVYNPNFSTCVSPSSLWSLPLPLWQLPTPRLNHHAEPAIPCRARTGVTSPPRVSTLEHPITAPAVPATRRPRPTVM